MGRGGRICVLVFLFTILFPWMATSVLANTLPISLSFSVWFFVFRSSFNCWFRVPIYVPLPALLRGVCGGTLISYACTCVSVVFAVVGVACDI